MLTWFEVKENGLFEVNGEIGRISRIRFDSSGEPIYTLVLQDGTLYFARHCELVRLG